jgi:predicted aspartyl protease
LSVVLLCSTFTAAQSNAQFEHIVPAKIYNGYLVVVQGSIGDLEKRNLAIDTGAYPSIIDQDLARKLHLEGEKGELRVVERNLKSRTAFVPSLAVGPMRATNLRVMVQDLTPISESFRVRIDALIGLDILVHTSFRIDYALKQVVFGPVDPTPYSVPMKWTDSMLCVDLNVNSRPTHLLVDTGAASLLLFADRVPWAREITDEAVGYSNIGGQFRLRRINAKSIELAGTNLGPSAVFVSEAHNMSPFHFDGLLATGVLPLRQIVFDMDRQRFGWEPTLSKADINRIRAARKPSTAVAMSQADSSDFVGSPCGIQGQNSICAGFSTMKDRSQHLNKN